MPAMHVHTGYQLHVYSRLVHCDHNVPLILYPQLQRWWRRVMVRRGLGPFKKGKKKGKGKGKGGKGKKGKKGKKKKKA